MVTACGIHWSKPTQSNVTMHVAFYLASQCGGGYPPHVRVGLPTRCQVGGGALTRFSKAEVAATDARRKAMARRRARPDQVSRRARSRPDRFAPPVAVAFGQSGPPLRATRRDYAGLGGETALQPNRELPISSASISATKEGCIYVAALVMPCSGSNNSRRSKRTQATPSILSATPRRARP